MSHTPQLSRMLFLNSGVNVIASTCSFEGAGVKQLTTTIRMTMTTNSQHSKISQLVCQNHVVASQKAPSMTALPESVMTLVIRRTKPIRKPPMRPHSPAYGVIFFENIPKVKTATMAGAISD